MLTLVLFDALFVELVVVGVPDDFLELVLVFQLPALVELVILDVSVPVKKVTKQLIKGLRSLIPTGTNAHLSLK